MKYRFLSTSFCILGFAIASFAQVTKPSAYAIVVDNTGSMRMQLQREIEIAKEVAKQIKDGSSFSIYAFSQARAEGRSAVFGSIVECTSKRDEVSSQLDNLFTVGGQTILIDGLFAIADRLGSSKPSTCADFGEKTIVVISDGEDRVSTTKPDALFAHLKQTGTKVLFAALMDDLGSSKGKVKEFVQKLVKETGGKAVFVNKKQSAKEVVRELFVAESKSGK